MIPRGLLIKYMTRKRMALAASALLIIGLAGCASDLAPKASVPRPTLRRTSAYSPVNSWTESRFTAFRPLKSWVRAAASDRAPEAGLCVAHDARAGDAVVQELAVRVHQRPTGN